MRQAAINKKSILQTIMENAKMLVSSLTETEVINRENDAYIDFMKEHLKSKRLQELEDADIIYEEKMIKQFKKMEEKERQGNIASQYDVNEEIARANLEKKSHNTIEHDNELTK